MANSFFSYTWATLVHLPCLSKLTKTLLKCAWRGHCGVQINTIRFFPSLFFLALLTVTIFVKISWGKSNHSHFFSHAAPQSLDLWLCSAFSVFAVLLCFFEKNATALCPLLLTFVLNQIVLHLRLARSRVSHCLGVCWASWRCYHWSWLPRSHCPLDAASRSITLQANSAEPAQGNWVDFAWSGRKELKFISERTAMKNNNLIWGMVKYTKAGKETQR